MQQLLSNGLEKIKCVHVCVCVFRDRERKKILKYRKKIKLMNLMKGYVGALCTILASFLQI